jgi:fatty acid desaturase
MAFFTGLLDDPDMGIDVRQQSETGLENVAWRDLVALSKKDIVIELTIAMPWLVAEAFFLFYNLWIPAVFCAFFFFLTGLRQVHGGFHLSLGISKRATDHFLCLMSILMLGAMHAVKFNHLRHHKYCMGAEDIEAKSAHMSALGALLFGPVFPILLHRQALLKGSPYYRNWILGELLANIIVVALAAFLYLQGVSLLLWHVVFMTIGQCMTAFFAVWTVHHDCDERLFARTQRGWLKNFISYDMFFHMEHHLFPKVPQKKLPILAARIDEHAPALKAKNVF